MLQVFEYTNITKKPFITLQSLDLCFVFVLDCLSSVSPDHGSDYPGSLSERWDGFVHQRMGLDEVEHLVRERVRGIKPGTLNSTATGSGDGKFQHTFSRP